MRFLWAFWILKMVVGYFDSRQFSEHFFWQPFWIYAIFLRS